MARGKLFSGRTVICRRVMVTLKHQRSGLIIPLGLAKGVKGRFIASDVAMKDQGNLEVQRSQSSVSAPKSLHLYLRNLLLFYLCLIIQEHLLM